MAAMSLFAVSCGNNEQVVTKTQVAPVVLKDSTVKISLSYPATIRGVQDVAIYPQVDGRIMDIYVKEGQKVKAGDALFAIDDIPFTSAYEVAQANLEMAKAGVETAKLTYESKKNLFDRQVISEYQLKLAYNDLLTARAALSQAKANLVKAHNDLSFTKVRTMVDGLVGNLPYKLGSLVGPSIPEPLTVVSDNSKVYADFSIAENTYLEIAKASKNDIKLPLSLIMNNGTVYEYPGEIYSRSGLISGETGALPMRSIFPNPDAKLLSGGAGTVVLSYDEPHSILIPRTSMKEIQNKMFVFKISKGKLEQVPVNAYHYDAKTWLLLPSEDGKLPLAPGDSITSTTSRLMDGMEIEVIKEQK